MKNGLIKKVIEEFRNRTLNVYKADSERIVRDARAADRAAKDHTGRWLFELLQNSDDAGATEVRVLVEDDTVYVADNGSGLKPGAVSAICGTDFSDKTGGTIGRKGVGFKSVYEVSWNPQVLTVDGEGIEFSPEKAKKFLQQNNLDDGQVPYQWIPFFIPWEDMERQDPYLGALTAYKTVVRLPGISPEKKQKVEQLLREWPPHALCAFRHLRKITAPGLEVVLRAGDGAWSLCDSRGQTLVEWQVARHTEWPSVDLLKVLGAVECRAISTDGVSFLIAAPLKNACVVPTSDYLPVHVFYPTEQKGPVRLLLHAEFLVKSDRTALMPVDGNPFNAWIADRLACHVCKFVNDSYRPESPSSHAALLVPFGERASHPVAEGLWQRIADKAQADLRLADVEARQGLTVSEARLISVNVRADLARTLLEATKVRGRLLHPAFDDDKEARKALKELGCKEIHDQDLMAAIAENADSHAGDTG
ncbi:MAG: ATP-binding protein [Ardenticatenaceae bacterium]|nr:ATP-binding protein [Ardenticatenaceae bacterium]